MWKRANWSSREEAASILRTRPAYAHWDAAAFAAYVASGFLPAPGGGVLHYYFGAFYRDTGAGFVVTDTPAGTVVSSLPDGYSREDLGGRKLYRFGPTAYRPVFAQGILSYQVAAPPAGP